MVNSGFNCQTEATVKKAGLRATTGLVLGKFKGKYMIDDGQTHVLVAAPTGSGKGVGVVIPNLLNWNGSAVVLDIKGENHELTSGFHFPKIRIGSIHSIRLIATRESALMISKILRLFFCQIMKTRYCQRHYGKNGRSP